MTPLTVHIINHTHWDREWFLTSTYTSRWIPGLIERLEALIAANPDFHYLFDGQTLVMEDLGVVSPDHARRAARLIRAGNLVIGPYYCQPDWQITDGELLIRNLLHGLNDVRAQGGAIAHTGWLVDTFGHVSQAPQIHRLFGIDAVYVWRGVPQLAPYFHWIGADGSKLFAVDLFGGYRNLYGVTHAPEVAVARLYAEVEKLRPYYPTPDIPLFDGYDLEDDPEDPLTFYADRKDIDPQIRLRESTPPLFAAEMGAHQVSLPVIHGELNSGKFGATFPGVFSARTYLKIMAHDSAAQLIRYAEPLATLAWMCGRPYPGATFERCTRLLLQNAVHDCICGVSIDLVHEKMEDIYRRVFDIAGQEVIAALAALLQDFAAGRYAVSTIPVAVDQWRTVGDRLVHIETDGVGVFPSGREFPINHTSQESAGFTWNNAFYRATVTPDGAIAVGDAVLGTFVVLEERGDTYTDETGDRLGEVRAVRPPKLVEQSAHHAVLAFEASWEDAQRSVAAVVRVCFDPTSLIRWQVDLDTRGADLRVEMIFTTAHSGAIYAGMPFDVVARPLADQDLLPRTVDVDLANILLGQRELNEVTTFPFHDFVAVDDGASTTAILARGLHAYSAGADGAIRLPLQRSVEWLTRADLKNRIGDAGPFFYVPDARAERSVRHELAVALGAFRADSLEMQAVNAAFQTPPLLVDAQGNGGARRWTVLRSPLPMSSLQVVNDTAVARLHNPTPVETRFDAPFTQIDAWGQAGGSIEGMTAKEITSVRVEAPAPVLLVRAPAPNPAVHLPAWRVGANQGHPDLTILIDLERRTVELTTALAKAEDALSAASDADARLRGQHRIYALARERAEYQLSLLLNRRKLASGSPANHAYLYDFDAEIAAHGLELNRLRIKRRIYDYVVAALPLTERTVHRRLQ